MSDDAEAEGSSVDDDPAIPDAPIDISAWLTELDDIDGELASDARELVEHTAEQADDLAEAEAEIEELTSRLKRARADFENYKKRVERRREDDRREATRRIVDRIIDVRQDLARAIETEGQDAEDLLDGIKLTLRELDRVLDAEGVTEITPDVGAPVDPHCHEVMVRVDSDQPADTIAEVYEPGYRHDDQVLKAAQVAVSTGDSGENEE